MLLVVLRDLFPFPAALHVLDAIAWVRAGHLLLDCQLGWCSVREPGIRLAGLLPVDMAFALSGPGPLAAWCPFCDTEYRAGFAACSDCSLPLHFLDTH